MLRVPCHHGMAHPQVANGGRYLLYANMYVTEAVMDNLQGVVPNLVCVHMHASTRLTIICHKNLHITKYHKGPEKWNMKLRLRFSWLRTGHNNQIW
jgi:hypothetical protein